jgi:hypothetical protein
VALRKLHLYVTSVPSGEAPLWVREQWLGLKLPLTGRQSVGNFYVSGVQIDGGRTPLISPFCGRHYRGNFQGNCDFRIGVSSIKIGIFRANSMGSGPTTFPDSRLFIPNQPALDSQLAARVIWYPRQQTVTEPHTTCSSPKRAHEKRLEEAS